MSRRLPSVDQVLTHAATRETIHRWGRETVKLGVRTVQEGIRRSGEAIPDWARDAGRYGDALEAWLAAEVGHGYETVFNLTGTIIHTNLGRSPLAADMAAAAAARATRPLTLEYDLDAGRRGSREGIVSHRLRLLTGAGGATAVNNNAAAVLLVLNTLARDRPVAVSRGELIEIGGSFRMPDIMASAGCSLHEVGTTNRTHASDYEAAAGAGAALLLKVHPSNYHIEGFTTEVAASELAAIGRRHGVPTCVDLGSGALVDLVRYGLPPEPTVRATLDSGVDLVTFSGDKLLGGVQAGLVVGSEELVRKLDRNPLKRALRLDKLALLLLDETLKAYESPESLTERVPLLRILTTAQAELERRGKAVVEVLGRIGHLNATVEASDAQIGSGALPDRLLPSLAVRIDPGQANADAVAARLRALRPAVIGRVAEGSVWLDLRCAEPLDELLRTLEGLDAGA